MKKNINCLFEEIEYKLFKNLSKYIGIYVSSFKWNKLYPERYCNVKRTSFYGQIFFNQAFDVQFSVKSSSVANKLFVEPIFNDQAYDKRINIFSSNKSIKKYCNRLINSNICQNDSYAWIFPRLLQYFESFLAHFI